MADFGSYTDEEWRDFQLSSEYAAALDTKLEASLDVRREEVHPTPLKSDSASLIRLNPEP